jgi:hypothetical protein
VLQTRADVELNSAQILIWYICPRGPQQSKFDVKLLKFKDGAKFTVLKEIRRLKPGMSLMDVSVIFIRTLHIGTSLCVLCGRPFECDYQI